MATERTRTIARHLQPLPNDKYPDRQTWDERKLPKENPYLIGNFAPTATEGEFLGLECSEGEIPTDLRGSYLRVGPNPRFDFTGLPYHTFDGDGFIHSVTFPADGTKPFYVKRWVRTRRLLTAELRGFDVAEMGEQAFGSFSYFEHVMDKLAPGHDAGGKGQRMGKANTNLVTYANRVLSLEEQDVPYEVVASWDPWSHLRTVGKFDFNHQLKHPVTAHPKIDPETHEMIFFGYDPISPRVSYSVGSPEGQLVRTLDIALPGTNHGGMMHDMAITKNYSLLFDMRLYFDMDAIAEGKNPWKHHLDLPARFGILPRHAQSSSEVQWIDVDPCAVFHFANAWEEADGTITVVGCRLPTVNFMQHEDNVKAGKVGAKKEEKTETLIFAKMHVWRLDPKNNKCIGERIISKHACDFVQVDPARVGRKSRYAYAQLFEDDPRKIPSQYRDSLFIATGLLKYDLEKGTVKEIKYRSKNGSQMYGTESVFAERNGRDGSQEDSGYMVVYCHDETSQQSECHVYRAEDLSLQCRIPIPERIPYGFHAHWVAGNVLK